MEFKWIYGEEMLAMLQPVIEHQGWTPLNPYTARALVAMEEGILCGFSVIQLFPHAEPMWVETDLRGSGLAEELATRMKKYLDDTQTRGYMVIADSPFAVKLCEERGMKRLTSPVYMMGGR